MSLAGTSVATTVPTSTGNESAAMLIAAPKIGLDVLLTSRKQSRLRSTWAPSTAQWFGHGNDRVYVVACERIVQIAERIVMGWVAGVAGGGKACDGQ